MTRTSQKTAIPTLTDIACPGEILREKGLWLPDNTVAPRPDKATSDDWRDRLPPALRDKADTLLEETRRRAHAAADAALARSPAEDRAAAAVPEWD